MITSTVFKIYFKLQNILVMHQECPSSAKYKLFISYAIKNYIIKGAILC